MTDLPFGPSEPILPAYTPDNLPEPGDVVWKYSLDENFQLVGRHVVTADGTHLDYCVPRDPDTA
jgi:hypothetical protein